MRAVRTGLAIVGIALVHTHALASDPVRPVPDASAIASAHPLATEAGARILERGGNAFDAAVAVSAALAVVEPYSSGLGGGGFWLLHRASDGFQTMVDGREVAPGAATPDMYLDADGTPVPGLSRDGALAAGIPGQPAGLVHIATKYGRLPLRDTLAPAIALAREGFPATERLAMGARFKQALLSKSPAAAAIFLPGGEPPGPGTVIRQPDLARTLEALASDGFDGFYRGAVAQRLVHGTRDAGGIWTLDDLAAYRAVERAPVRGRYGDVRIVTAPPPSAGGVLLVNMLNILAGFDLDRLDEVTRTHLLVESMRRAYRDRAQYLGDPDFVTVPVEQLIHPYYAAGQRAGMRFDRATPSGSLPGYLPAGSGGADTTHFSILDRDGNRVAGTMSINFWFGSGFMAPGTGVILNNEMDDFSVKAGVPDGFELVGGDANAITPGKRMLSSMTPTFIESDEGVLILGTPGGSRIISMVLLAGLEWYHRDADAQQLVSLPRFHHQYMPDHIVHEPEALNGVATALGALGHRLQKSSRRYGNLQVVTWDYESGRVEAASDPRGEGAGHVY